MSTHYFINGVNHAAGPGGSVKLTPGTGTHDIDLITVFSDTSLHGTVTVTGTQTTAQVFLPTTQFSQLNTDLGTVGATVSVGFDWSSPTVSNWTEHT